MKKLMIASAAAVLASVGFAEVFNSTGFEDVSVGETKIAGWSDNATSTSIGDVYWWGAEGSAVSNAQGQAYSAACGFPGSFTGLGNNYLDLNTENDILWRSVNPAAKPDADWENGTPKAVDAEKGLYVDTMVQFTITEPGNEPEPATGDKLAIWLGSVTNAEGEVTGTNLFVKAMQYDDDGYNTTFTDKAFALSATDIVPGAWYRLTVKTIADVTASQSVGGNEAGIVGFQIYLDGTLLTSQDSSFTDGWLDMAKNLSEIGWLDEVENAEIISLLGSGSVFASLQGEETVFQLSGVGFKGSGAIDDLVITDELPNFLTPVVPVDFTVTIPTGASATYAIGTGAPEALPAGGVISGAEGAAVTVVITLADGTVVTKTGTITEDGTLDLSTVDWTFYLADADEDGVYDIATAADFASFKKGVAALATAGESFELTADVTIPDTFQVTAEFSGTFDGGNHTVNFTLVGEKYTGFFKILKDANVSNLILNTASDYSATGDVGGGIFAGAAYGTCRFENITTMGSFKATHNCCGQICYDGGKSGVALTFVACTNHAALTANYSKAGGIFGYSQSSGATVDFVNCYNDGAITLTGGDDVAGSKIGGILAGSWSNVAYTFTGCANAGALTGTQNICKNSSNWSVDIGGITGQLTGGSGTLTDCSNTGAISGTSGAGANGAVNADAEIGGVGGLVGRAGVAVTLAGTIESLGTVTSVVKENPARVKCGSLIGNSASVTVAQGAVVKSNQLMMPLGSSACAALNFAAVDDVNLVATFQAAPTAAGNYAVTLPNSDAITFGEAENDQLVLITNICAYTGTVATEVDGCEVVATPFAQDSYLGVIYTVTDAGGDDWPDDPSTVAGETAGDVFGLEGDLADEDAAAVATWAKEKVAYADRATAIKPEAYLLNCANTDEAIAEAKAAFVITSIEKDGENWVVKVTSDKGEGETYGNGKVVIKGSTTLDGTYEAGTTGACFFKAFLEFKGIPVTE